MTRKTKRILALLVALVLAKRISVRTPGYEHTGLPTVAAASPEGL